MIFWIKYSARSVLRRYKKNIIIFAGFSFSIAVLIFLAAVMTGVNDTMINNALELHNGHITIEGETDNYQETIDKLSLLSSAVSSDLPGSKTLKRIYLPAIIKTERSSLPVQLTGIDQRAEMKTTILPEKVIDGDYTDKSGLLISRKISDQIGAVTGDNVFIFTPDSKISFKISGLYSTGVENFDSKMVFLDMENLKFFKNEKTWFQLSVFLENSDNIESEIKTVKTAAGRESVKGWYEKLPEIYQLVKLNRAAMYIMIFLVILIIGFSIANTMVTSVLERKKYFSILKALGAGTGEILIVIISESLILTTAAGIAGTLTGMLTAYLVSLSGGIDLSSYTSFNPNFAVNSIIIPRMTMEMTLFPPLSAFAIGAAASLIPAYKTVKQKVVKGMSNI